MHTTQTTLYARSLAAYLMCSRVCGGAVNLGAHMCVAESGVWSPLGAQPMDARAAHNIYKSLWCESFTVPDFGALHMGVDTQCVHECECAHSLRACIGVCVIACVCVRMRPNCE